jgi:opacity protein-like surface antigen
VPHLLGIGAGLMPGSPVGFGATARAWTGNRLGVRVDISRMATGTAATTRASSLQIEPSAQLLLADYVGTFVWLRPYVGAGMSLRHQTFRSGLTGVSAASDNSTGFQAFAGTELTVANAPQLALSADLGYRSQRSAFGVFDVGGFGVAMSAHWYLR